MAKQTQETPTVGEKPSRQALEAAAYRLVLQIELAQNQLRQVQQAIAEADKAGE